MGYAVRKDGAGWRAVNGPEDCLNDESFSQQQPLIVPLQTVIVPETISDRQFFAVLEKMGRISYEEALQAVKTGDLPPAFEAFLASLDDDKQKSYRLFMEGETFFSRNHQITLDLAAFFKMTDQQVDAIFIEGDKL